MNCYCRGLAVCPNCDQHTCTDCCCTETDHWKDES